MHLREYLFKNRITYKRFADISEYTPQYICAVINGGSKPGKKFKYIVKQITEGEVSDNDWDIERETG